MSTRSSVGTIDADGNYKGRYVHSDGYPTHLAAELAKLIVKTDGALEYVLKVLTEEHYGWSYLDADEDEPTHGNFLGERGEFVSGFGLAYTTAQGQSAPEEWVTTEADWGTEWAYGFTSTDPTTAELVVFKVKWGGGDSDATFIEVERVPVKLFGQAGEVDWAKIEEKGRFGQ